MGALGFGGVLGLVGALELALRTDCVAEERMSALPSGALARPWPPLLLG